MSCGTCMKVVVIITNILFALASLALIGVGVASLLVVHGSGPIVIIVVGAVAFVISFFGCCGAIMANKCMLFTYSMLLIILMNLKTALATAIIVAQDSIKTAAIDLLQAQFSASPESISSFENALECCGTTGVQSYAYLNALTLPLSCCKDASVCTMMNAYKQGCNDALADFVTDFGVGIAACCFIIVIIELIAVIFGLCLADYVSNKHKNRY